MTRWLTIPLALVLSGSTAHSWDIRKMPGAADRQRILSGEWPAARDALGAALLAGYQPGGPGRPGSTGLAAYRSWLLLWKWCEILSRSEKDECLRHVLGRVRLSIENGNPVVITPGYSPTPAHKALSPADVEELANHPEVLAGLLRRLVPPDTAQASARLLAERVRPEVVAEWTADEKFSEAFFGNLSDEDFLPGVLARLEEIRLAHPAKFREYHALAIAIALVYDQRFPRFWPHRQVNPDLVPMVSLPAAERFAFWVESNETNGLLTDLRQQSVGELKYIVDAPLDPSEFAWARKNVRYNRSDFAKAFSSVSYASGRAVKRDFDWEEGEYTLENIRARSGICVDQAYYAMVAGKARGLPTLFFVGQGADGGHAWFGYLKAEHRWALDCGRYENQNYALGTALDPQSWRPISDHELELLTNSSRQKFEFIASRNDVFIARAFERAGDSAGAARAYSAAIQACPENDEAWAARADFLERTGATPHVLKAHYEAALKQFAANRDLRAAQQTALAILARREGDLQTAGTLERQLISQNKRRRSDLSVTAGASRLSTLVNSRQYDEAFKEYRRLLTVVGQKGGGNFFYEIVQPFVDAFAGAGETSRAREAIALARKALNPEAGSILDHEFGELARSLEQPAE